MTRKEELEARARDYVSLFVMSGAEPAATKNLAWMLKEVERDVLERVEYYYSTECDDAMTFSEWLKAQQTLKETI